MRLCATFLLLVVSCASGDNRCDEALQRLESCSMGDRMPSSCAEEWAAVVATSSCDELLADASDVKGDGRIGWREPGEECMLNFECQTPYVCRPYHNMLGALSFRCQPRALTHGTCDSSADCVVGDCSARWSALWDGTCEPAACPSGREVNDAWCQNGAVVWCNEGYEPTMGVGTDCRNSLLKCVEDPDPRSDHTFAYCQ